MAAKYLLIADPDQKTLVKLEEALRDLDVHVSVAADGAQALERALTVRQDMFLFSDRLPVIDTPKLAEILRANPRTANVPLVLLRSDAGSAAYGDGSLARPVQREELVNMVLRHAFKVGALQESGEKLSGLLSEIPIPDLLQIMRANRREGTLEIAGTPTGSIWVRRGEVVDARAGKAEGMKAFFRLLEAREGRFTFKAAKVNRQPTLELPLEGLLLEAARQRDEVARLCRDKPLQGRLVLLREITALPEGLHPVHRELLLLVEFYGNVEDVVENARVTELEAHLGLRSLAEASIIGSAVGNDRGAEGSFRLEPALIMNLKQLAGHTPRRVRPIRIAVFVSASSVISEVNDLLQPARWVRNQDRVLGNQIIHALDGEFVLRVDFFPPGRDFGPLLELPTGLLVGGLVLTTANDDKELDYLNESAALLQERSLPVEYAFMGEGDPEWARKAFDVPANSTVHQVQRGAFSPLIEAVRALLVRRAAAAGWSVAAR
jgi:CheY-like chemotaxis protein